VPGRKIVRGAFCDLWGGHRSTRMMTRRKSKMQRLKNTENVPSSRPVPHWLAGMMIGSIVVTMATHAMLLGAGAAISGSTLKDR
jgi:hypothetical protein